MNKKILAKLDNKTIGELFEVGAGTEFRYFTDKLKDSICISMPANNLTYRYHSGLLPFFDMFIPEGFLFEYLKQIIHKKEGKLNDFILLWYLAEGVKTKAKLTGRNIQTGQEKYITMEELEENDTQDTFMRLLNIFLDKNAIGGIQPKTIAIVKDKANLPADEYIIKTFGEVYPNLTEIEYFCLKVAKKTGLKTPEFKLSKNKNFLIIKRFDNGNLFFEEAGSLLGKTKLDKYTGSYEQIANKVIKRFSKNVEKDLKDYFKMIVINNLIKNGDAHLKNFGLLFNKDFSNIRLAPAYDLICTAIYIKDDKPALTIKGKHKWLDKQELINFGQEICLLTKEEAKEDIDICINAVEETINEIESYIKDNKEFKEMALRMINIWNNSLSSLENRKTISLNLNRGNNNGNTPDR